MSVSESTDPDLETEQPIDEYTKTIQDLAAEALEKREELLKAERAINFYRSLRNHLVAASEMINRSQQESQSSFRSFLQSLPSQINPSVPFFNALILEAANIHPPPTLTVKTVLHTSPRSRSSSLTSSSVSSSPLFPQPTSSLPAQDEPTSSNLALSLSDPPSAKDPPPSAADTSLEEHPLDHPALDHPLLDHPLPEHTALENSALENTALENPALDSLLDRSAPSSSEEITIPIPSLYLTDKDDDDASFPPSSPSSTHSPSPSLSPSPSPSPSPSSSSSANPSPADPSPVSIALSSNTIINNNNTNNNNPPCTTSSSHTPPPPITSSLSLASPPALPSKPPPTTPPTMRFAMSYSTSSIPTALQPDESKRALLPLLSMNYGNSALPPIVPPRRLQKLVGGMSFGDMSASAPSPRNLMTEIVFEDSGDVQPLDVVEGDLLFVADEPKAGQHLARRFSPLGKFSELGWITQDNLAEPLAKLTPAVFRPRLAEGAQETAEFLECVAAFNEKPKKAIQLLQERKIIDGEHPYLIAQFLQHPKLDKMVLGDYLGDRAEGRDDVRVCFVASFRFRDLEFDVALRRYLYAFRLPGESQKIDRLLDCFARKYYEDNRFSENIGFFAHPDSAFVLAFSTIMLNTDLHSPQIKKARMTLPQFIRNNRGQNNGQDFPHEFLEDLYNRILDEEIKMKDDIVFPHSLERSYLDVETRQGLLSRSAWKRQWLILDHDYQLYFFKTSSQRIPASKFDLSAPLDLIFEEHLNSKNPKSTQRTYLWIFKPQGSAPTPRDGGISNSIRVSTDSLRVCQRWYKIFSRMPNLHIENHPFDKSTSDPSIPPSN